ncbi:ATP-binding protein [Streptomyces sp. Isolate_219]|uniref:ATP-binding protein n=1 Tax=Streptomyces sp. Isolate_219 TaxID=2950110 RepID=UPI0021C5A871|nr:ATP-binding protein [Streptomyces sp. Isolate_219]MCR8574445.1 ATP-binding protein [Streptomyces sp. Isolate_219]
MHPQTAPVTRPSIRVSAGARPHLLTAPSTPLAPKTARDFVRAVLRRSPLAPLLDTALLLTSEAVTSSHLRTPRSADILLRMLTTGHGLRISVHDEAPVRIPRPTAVAGEQEADHGLLLTGHLADDWGTTPFGGLPRSTSFWFELHLKH